VVVTGTAVRSSADEPSGGHFGVKYRTPFLCDLSARDFVVLSRAGWYPLDLVAGVSYVHAPRRNLRTSIGQSVQNVELANYTETLYAAREAAMGELQSHLNAAGGTGLVDAKIVDRPVHFARHVVEFMVYGTAVKMLAQAHTHPDLSVVLPLDDEVRTFEATSLD
ncbi:MAG: heavy metal-binding domain-containing protein, partial [Acidimicrobiales bacterium]